MRQLREFTPERLTQVRESWESHSGEDEVAVELSLVFDWAEDHLKLKDNNSQALELTNPAGDAADAIVEIVNSKRGSLVKLLRIHYGPHLWGADEDPVKLREVSDVMSDALLEVLSTYLGKRTITELKVYGRNNVMLRVLEHVHDHWGEAGPWFARMEGRWLAFHNT